MFAYIVGNCLLFQHLKGVKMERNFECLDMLMGVSASARKASTCEVNVQSVVLISNPVKSHADWKNLHSIPSLLDTPGYTILRAVFCLYCIIMGGVWNIAHYRKWVRQNIRNTSQYNAVRFKNITCMFQSLLKHYWNCLFSPIYLPALTPFWDLINNLDMKSLPLQTWLLTVLVKL